MTGIESQLVTLMSLFGVAAVAALVAARYTRLHYTTVLLIAGLLVSVAGVPLDIEPSPEIILLVILPALIFKDAIDIDVRAFRANVVPILLLAVVGLLVSIALLAVVSQTVFGFSLAFAVLFAAIIMPTDPVSVLAVFDDLGVPERLNILVEGESLLNDGVSIVVYSSVLAVVVEAEAQGVSVDSLVTPGQFVADVGVGILFALVAGVVAGGIAGYVAYELIAIADDELTAVMLSVLVAYGVYIALDILGGSGVIGTLTAGVFLASRGDRPEISPQTHFAVETLWHYATFIANAILFVAIGVLMPFDLLAQYAPEIGVAIVLVFLARAVVIYPLVALFNRGRAAPISRAYQHVLAWGGIHASVSIALVLGVAEEFPGPLARGLTALVFGVAAFTLLVNGLTMGRLIDSLDISKQRPGERLYEALVGRRHGIDAALDAAERLLERDEISTGVFEDIRTAYGRERMELDAATETLLERYPDIREHEERLGQRRVLVAAHQGIHDAMQRGIISREVGDHLLADVETELGRLMSDEWSAEAPQPPSVTPYWREQLRAVTRGADREREPESQSENTSRSEDAPGSRGRSAK